MARRRSLRGTLPFGIVPAVSLLVLFFVTPLIVLAYYSLLTFEQGIIVGGPSLEGYSQIVRDPFVHFLFARTTGLSFFVVGVCLLLGYPLAFLYSRTSSSFWKTAILVSVMAPLLTSNLIRTFAWLVLLGKQGLFNETLLALGIIKDPITMLYTVQSVAVGMSQVLLPFMIVPLIASLDSLPRDIGDAAANLGATRWRTFWEIILPQSVPGITAGVSLVFTLAYTMFTVPTVMGGASFRVVSVYIWNSINMLTWDKASGIAALLLISALGIIYVINLISRRLAPWQYLHE